MVYTLSKKDSDDPSRIYCYAVKRNPTVKDRLTGNVRQQRRSPYNDNKTRVLRRTLYNRLGGDDTLSFCYSDDPAKSRTDEEIISNWASKKTDEYLLHLAVSLQLVHLNISPSYGIIHPWTIATFWLDAAGGCSCAVCILWANSGHW